MNSMLENAKNQIIVLTDNANEILEKVKNGEEVEKELIELSGGSITFASLIMPIVTELKTSRNVDELSIAWDLDKMYELLKQKFQFIDYLNSKL